MQYKLKGLVTQDLYDSFVRVLDSPSSKTVLLPAEDGIIGPVHYVADPAELATYAAPYKRLYESPPGYFVAFGAPDKLLNMGCSFDLSGKTVGYFTKTDRDFITAILNGYRIKRTAVRFNQISIFSTKKMLSRDLERSDIVITFVIPDSPLHTWLLQQRIALMGFKKLDIHRVHLFYPHVTMQDVNMKTTLLGASDGSDRSFVRAVVSSEEEESALPTMQLTMIEVLADSYAEQDVSKSINASGPSVVEEFVTRLKLSAQSLDPTYRCYGDVNIKTKALCDSPYDEIGQPKTRNTTWDQPCIEDSDCPYYKSNKRYNNSRGGCGRQFPGVCELPIGVRRIAFRQYDDEGVFAPFCYDCDPYDTSCCSKQGSNPDYAFEDDTDARRASGLKTSIPME